MTTEPEVLRDYGRAVRDLQNLRHLVLEMLRAQTKAEYARDMLARRITKDMQIPGEFIEATCERIGIPRQWVI